MTQSNLPQREDTDGPVRQFLRQHTHAAHSALNRHPMLSGITRPGYPIHQYQALLGAYLPLYAGLEQAIEQFLHQQPLAFEYVTRRKLPWLERDLKFFGHQVPSTPVVIQPIESVAELIGLLYVIEGSTLGGELIARLIFQNLGIDASHGGAFFYSYGSETQARWRGFCDFIETLADASALQNAAAWRAVETFRLFHQTLERAHQAAIRSMELTADNC